MILEQARCMRKVRYPSACLPFQLPSDIHASDLSTAELWFYKKADSEDAHNQTFIITETAHWDTKKSFQKTTPIAIQQSNLSGKFFFQKLCIQTYSKINNFRRMG